MKWFSKHLCKGVEKSKCLDKMCMGILCWNKIWVFLCEMPPDMFSACKRAGGKKKSIDFSSWGEKKIYIFKLCAKKFCFVGLPGGWSLNYCSTFFSSGTVTCTLLIHWKRVIRMAILVVLHVVHNKCQHPGSSVCLTATMASVQTYI